MTLFQSGPVGRDFQIINDVPGARPRYSAKGWPTVASSRRISRPSTWSGQAQFAGRAQHAVGFDAANLADFDGQGRFAGLAGQGVAGQNQRNLVAGLEILRAANDLALAAAVVDAAEGKFVGIGMFVAGEDLGDDDAVQFAADFLHALDFEAEQGETPGQFFGGPVEMDVLPEPVESDFHAGGRK